MIASSVNITLHPDDLVLLAKKKSITNYGEMFSAQNMADFAQDILSFSFDIILMSCSIKGLCYQLQKYFDDGSLIMIPYPFVACHIFICNFVRIQKPSG